MLGVGCPGALFIYGRRPPTLSRITATEEFRRRIFEPNSGNPFPLFNLRKIGYDLSDDDDRDEVLNHLRQLVRDGYAPANGLYGMIINHAI
jgi:hypothetical protein